MPKATEVESTESESESRPLSIVVWSLKQAWSNVILNTTNQIVKAMGKLSKPWAVSISQFEHTAIAGPPLCFGVCVECRSQYTLTVEASPAVESSLGSTYRFFIDLEWMPPDQVSAVYGNNQTTLSSGVSHSEYSTVHSTSAGMPPGINPQFLPLFPEMAADSLCLAVGLQGPASILWYCRCTRPNNCRRCNLATLTVFSH